MLRVSAWRWRRIDRSSFLLPLALTLPFRPPLSASQLGFSQSALGKYGAGAPEVLHGSRPTYLLFQMIEC